MYKLLIVAGLVFILCGCESVTVTGRIPLPMPPNDPPPAPPGSEGTTVVYHPKGLFPAALHIPKGHLPRPGLCRIWFPGRPPGQQPPPGDCAELAARVPPGAWLLSRPFKEKKKVHVRVYDQDRPGIIVVIRVFDAATGRFVQDITP